MAGWTPERHVEGTVLKPGKGASTRFFVVFLLLLRSYIRLFLVFL
jgi:hypothetical protein